MLVTVIVHTIVSARRGLLFKLEKSLADLLQKYVGMNPSYLRNSTDFIKRISNLRIHAGDLLVRLDISKLYPSLPRDETLVAINEVLVQEPDIGDNHHRLTLYNSAIIFGITRTSNLMGSSISSVMVRRPE